MTCLGVTFGQRRVPSNVLQNLVLSIGLFAIDEAYGILLCEKRMTASLITSYAVRFRPQHISDILRVLDESDNGLSVPEIQRVLNLGQTQIDKTIKFLTAQSPSPVTKISAKWQLTAATGSYRVDQAYVDAITNTRQAEQQQMRDYMTHPHCLMAFVQAALDDPYPEPCGQ